MSLVRLGEMRGEAFDFALVRSTIATGSVTHLGLDCIAAVTSTCGAAVDARTRRTRAAERAAAGR
jgi:hypothetical protein